MSNNDSANPMANASREEVISALFANLVMQQANMAFMFLGRVPHPESGEIIQDLESAKFFIDQLEMIEAKTKGNLDKREEGLLKQSLTGLRMAFVEAINQGQSPAPESAPESSIPPSPPESAKPDAPAADATTAADEESRKKFSKKY